MWIAFHAGSPSPDSRRGATTEPLPTQPSAPTRRHASLVAIARLALIAAAGWALHRELHDLRPAGVWAALSGYGWTHVSLGFACTGASFLLLGAFEWLALRSSADPAARKVPARRAFATGFVANALSQSVGLALLTGSAVRLRAYERAGLRSAGVAGVSAFVTLTVTLGLLASAAAAFLASGAPVVLGRFSISVVPAGIVLAAAVLAYLAWSATGAGESVGIGRWRLSRPPVALAAAQVALSALDWCITGAVLYAFLPPGAGLQFATMLRAYIIAQTAGVMSHVPGGIGVFELVFLSLLAPSGAGERAAVLAALLMYRVVYYLAPLLLAMAGAAVSELLPRRRRERTLAFEELVHAD